MSSPDRWRVGVVGAGRVVVGAALAAARAVLDATPGIDLDYLALTGPDLAGLRPAAAAPTVGRLLVAALVGDPRLIDNIALDLGS